jgi:DNA transformation protein and related proteins
MAQAPKLLNVGPKSAAWLRQVGVRTAEDLQALGSVGAFMKVKRAGFRPSLNLLYALEGALLGCHWQQLPEHRRGELLIAVDAAEASLPQARGRAAGAVIERSGAEHEADQAMEEPSFGFDDPAASTESE